MNKAAVTRKDIDEVLDLMQTFMHQFDSRFNKIEEDIADIKISLNRLTNTVDALHKPYLQT